MDTFKTTIYHLYHGHTTERVDDRFSIKKRHVGYDKQGWIDHIMRNHIWGVPEQTINDSIVNETLLYAFQNTDTPLLTVCMVTYKRYDSLIQVLENYVNLKSNINIILWVNDSESMPQDIKDKVIDLLKNFKNHDIIYCRKNMGTGYPRYMMLNKAYYEYETPYIMTTDDDIIFENTDSIFMGSSILYQEKYKDYGSIGLWCSPNYFILRESNGVSIHDKPTNGFIDVHTLGAATMTIRREVIEKTNVDPNYQIGLVDWDFSKSIENEGFKLGLLCDDKYKPVNLYSQVSDSDYIKDRTNKSVINKSKERFQKKWNIVL